MLRRICKICGRETSKELSVEGPKFFCKTCKDYPQYVELDMEPHCPQCGDLIEECVKCGTGYFCNRCKRLFSRKDLAWKDKEA